MSKSLKNFITIKDILSKYTAQTVRLFVLMHKYDSPLEYFPNKSFDEVTSRANKQKEFFLNIKAALRTNPMSAPQKWSQKESVGILFSQPTKLSKDLYKEFEMNKSKIHAEFCNNFNTPGVIQAIEDLMKATNIYLMKPNQVYCILNSIYKYLKFIFDVFEFYC